MVDYVADYLENIRDRRPLSNVKPGYLRELVPDEAPRDPEPWHDVFQDIERVIMPGVSQSVSLSVLRVYVFIASWEEKNNRYLLKPAFTRKCRP